jgi:hypothetical protein
MRAPRTREALDAAQVALSASRLGTRRAWTPRELAHAMGTDRTRLFLDPDGPVEGAAVLTSANGRSAGAPCCARPVAYITGTKPSAA